MQVGGRPARYPMIAPDDRPRSQVQIGCASTSRVGCECAGAQQNMGKGFDIGSWRAAGRCRSEAGFARSTKEHGTGRWQAI